MAVLGCSDPLLVPCSVALCQGTEGAKWVALVGLWLICCGVVGGGGKPSLLGGSQRRGGSVLRVGEPWVSRECARSRQLLPRRWNLPPAMQAPLLCFPSLLLL